MEFNEKTAIEIIKKHNLSEKTLRVWKNRGKIPKRYFKEGFKKRKSLPINSAQTKYLIRVINHPFLRKKSFATPEVPYFDITDSIKEQPRYRIDENQYNILYGQIVRLSGQMRELTKKNFTEKNGENLRDFLIENPYLVYTRIIGAAELESNSVWKKKGLDITSRKDYEKVIHQLILLIADLKP